MKRILMIATGGTIASRRTSTGLAPLITSREVLQYVPEVQSFCAVDTLQLFSLDSTNIWPEHWLKIAAAIREHYHQYDGFVICHGTDTMAYTAAALSYLIQNCPKPIIITGAQKPIDLEITDAKTNLTDSFLYASCADAAGVHIVFDGKVILGTRAKKARSKSYNAFSSINYPYPAIIQDGRVITYIPQRPRGALQFWDRLNPNVALVKLTPGFRPEFLAYLLSKNDGVIIESYGVGGVPHNEYCDFPAVIAEGAQAGKTIVMTTQVLSEGSDMTIYQVGHQIKKEYDIIEAYDMTTEAVVTKLMWILGQTSDPSRISQLFYTPVHCDLFAPEDAG